MPLHYRSLLTLEYKDLISEKFNFLVNFFDFEPGDIFIEVLPLKMFERYCKFEGIKISNWGVGVALNNGKIIILDKKDFEKKSIKRKNLKE